MDITITTERLCYFPGELVRCFVRVTHITTDPTAYLPISQVQLNVQCSGTEGVDPQWLSRLYRPEVATRRENRRVVRDVFTSTLAVLLDAVEERSGFQRAFRVRFRLPTHIPPSYRGTAVRIQYAVSAHGSFCLPGRDPSKVVHAHSHCAFLVWPLAARLRERRPSIQPAGSAGTAAQAALEEAAAAVGPGQQQQQQQQGHQAPDADGAGGQQQQQQQALPAPAPVAQPAQQEPDVIDYRLGVADVNVKWEELPLTAPAAAAMLALQSHSSLALSHMASVRTASLTTAVSEVLALEGPQRSGAELGSTDEWGEGEGGDEDDVALGLRQLTPLQRSSMVPRTYSLRAGDHPLVRVTLQPPPDTLLQPGGTLGVLLDFRAAHGAAAAAAAAADGAEGRGARPSCIQVAALLESEEVLHPPYAHARGASGDAATGAMRRLHSEQQELTGHLLSTHFVFSIPPSATPSFRTAMVSLRWVLRFELTLATPLQGLKAGGADGWQGATEQLVWRLPVVVFPPPWPNTS